MPFLAVTSKVLQLLISRKPCSNYKMKEITGSGIFAAKGEDDESESDSANPGNKTGVRMYQVSFLHLH